MGALTFDALLRSLKQGAPDPVYYLHGDEDVLKDEAIRALVERAVDPAARDFNVDQRSAADLDPEAFHTLPGRRGTVACGCGKRPRGTGPGARKARSRRGEPTGHARRGRRAGGGASRRNGAGPGGRRARAARGRRRPPRGTGARAGGDERGTRRHGPRDRARRHRAGAGGARPRGPPGPPRIGDPVAPTGRPPLRPRQLGPHRGALGPLGRCVERGGAVAGAAARARRRPRAPVQHGHGRTRDPRAAGAAMRGAGAGGRVQPAGRRVGGWAVSVTLLALTAYPPTRLTAQTDTLRAAALRIAQTRPDSARAMMRRLLARLTPQDSLYPGALFTAGIIASDAGTVATTLQRVVVEYGRSVWADSALWRLAQLYFAQGDPAATVQAAERLRQDYPDSPLRARADFTGAQGYFALKDGAHACPLIQEALDRAGSDVEFKNQVDFYAARCTPATAAPPPPAAGDRKSKRAPTVASYAVQVLAVKSAAQGDEMLTRLKAR